MLWEALEAILGTIGVIGIIALVILAVFIFPFVILHFCGLICWAGICAVAILGPFLLVIMGYEFLKGQRRDEYRSQLLQNGYSLEQVERIIKERGL
jgi:hypothetical protein